MLETARVCGTIRRFMHVSTDEVYGETSHNTGLASLEQSTLLPTNPYAASKAAAEMLVRAYHQTYKLPCVVTRGNNVYGPHQARATFRFLLFPSSPTALPSPGFDTFLFRLQYPEKLVPKFVLLACLGRKLPVHGDGSALRSYLYVSDAAAAFDIILHKGAVGEVYNLGTVSELSTLAVTRSICQHLAADPASALHVEDRLYNDRRYFISSDKLQRLGWGVTISWDEGLKRTIEWYKEHVLNGALWPGYESALCAHPIVREMS